MNHLKTNYVSPECETYAIATEGVLCASGELWYEQGGRGSFNYGVDDNDDFGW